MGSSGHSGEAMKELEEALFEVGYKLLKPPSSTHELLILLEEVEKLLPSVPQNPRRSMKIAIHPALVALIRDEIFKHPDPDVQVAVAACINEMVKISAPTYTYEDEIMKEIFPLFMNALKHLPCGSGINYKRALRILECMARGQSCLIMLEIDIDPMIVEMFQFFLDTIRPNHCCKMFNYMQTIMGLIIQESDDISVELLRPLLSSAKMDNKNNSPKSWELAKSIFESCASILQDYVREAVIEMELNVNDYTEIIASLCQDTPIGGDTVTNEEVEEVPSVQVASEEIEEVATVQFVATNTSGDGVPKMDEESEAGPSTQIQEQRSRRRIKPNTLMSPDDGYYYHYKELNNAKQGWSKKRKRNQDPPEEVPSIPTIKIIQYKMKRKGSGQQKKTAKGVIFGCSRVGVEEEPVNRNADSEGQGKNEITSQKNELGDVVNKMVDSPASEPIKSKRSKVEQKDSKKVKKTTKVVNVPSSSVVAENGKVSQSAAAPGEKGKRSTQSVLRSSALGAEKEKVVESSMSELAKAEYPGDLDQEKQKEPMDFRPKFGQELVNMRIMVWWPLDEIYYTGTVQSYDPVRKKHKIKYDDDDEEILDMSEERWEWFFERHPQQAASSCEREAAPSPAKDHGKTQEKTTKRKASSSKKEHTGSSSKRSKSEGHSIVKSRHSAVESVPVNVESDDETFEANFSWKAKAMSHAGKKEPKTRVKLSQGGLGVQSNF